MAGFNLITEEALPELIFRMVAETSTWGAPRIHGELKIVHQLDGAPPRHLVVLAKDSGQPQFLRSFGVGMITSFIMRNSDEETTPRECESVVDG